MWALWWTVWHWGRFSPSTSVSPANHHSTNVSIIIITQGGHSRPIGGAVPSGANWTPSPTIGIKKKLQITHEVFFAQCNSFLTIYFQSPSTAISRTLPNSRQLNSPLELLVISSGRTPRKTRLLSSRIVLSVFTDPLSSNRRPLVARVGSHGNVFTESLPSNGSLYHNI
jgi:hypothetical protein